MPRRVVITGIGVVAPNGTGAEAFWQATCRGVSGIKRIARFATAQIPISVAGEVDSFVAEDVLDRKLVNRTDRMTHFALAAVAEALTDSRIDLAREPLHRVGAVIANTMGGVTYIMAQIAALHLRGPRFMSAHSAIAWPQGANVGQTAVRYGLQGYCTTPVNDTVGGLDALGMAYRAIRRGAVEVMITGGCEALLHPTMLMVLAHSNHCTTDSDLTAYRPFDRRANGLILAEGAGICILEAYDHALQRSAPLYGEVVGYGQTHDAATWNTPPKSGTHYARAITLAMHEGGIAPMEIGYVSLDGRATPAWDRTEADALHQALGAEADRLPVSVPRTTIGHSYAAAGALDTITALLGLHHCLVPPTINCQEVDDGYGLNVVRDTPGHLTRPVVLIGGRGMSGANVVLAIKRLSEP